MTIGATEKTDKKASWSNFGNCVDWFAPGVGITSAWATSDVATNTISGTSMATPHTTGVAALYLESHPGASPQAVRDALFANTTKGIVIPLDSLGRGKLMAYEVPVRCGGVLVHPGELVFADFDGVVIVPRALEKESLALAREKVTKENHSRRDLLRGDTLRAVFDRHGVL